MVDAAARDNAVAAARHDAVASARHDAVASARHDAVASARHDAVAAARDDAVVRELRGAGLRVTMARQAVLTWLTAHPHATADAVAEGVAAEFGTLSRQAVYDVLAVCTRAGLLRRIEPAGHPARFERRVGDGHHHLVCRGCGRTEDTDCAAGERPCLDLAEQHGFVVDEAEVIFWGRCPACAADRGPQPAENKG